MRVAERVLGTVVVVLAATACGGGNEASSEDASLRAIAKTPLCKQVGSFLDAGTAARSEAMRALKERRGPAETQRTLQPLINDVSGRLVELGKPAPVEAGFPFDALQTQMYEADIARLQNSNWDSTKINQGDPLMISNAFARAGGWYDEQCRRPETPAQVRAREAAVEASQRDPEEVVKQQTIVAAALSAAALIASAALALYLHHGRLALHPADPYRLLLGGRDIALRHTKGRSADASRMASTRVSGGGGYITTDAMGYVHGSIDPITSVTTIHEQFFIETGDGSVRAIQLRNWSFPVGTGHLVSALEFGTGQRQEQTLAVINHSADTSLTDKDYLREHLGYRAWRTRLLELLGVFGLAIAGTVIGSLLEPDSTSEVAGQAGGFAFLGSSFGAVLGTFIGSVVWIWGVRQQMVARFLASDWLRLHQAMTDAPITGAAEAGSVPGGAPAG